ncbi:ECF transporter S component, folate family [Acetanaerobacterium elongatum]|uniref:ECF transporter S component, folate family n=1 Tax=Acetanaerobacterium elongatum TaxID=258515 RepID=A0A1H0BEV4_9FIRM|nr:ECF transporter S component, folate family [Acetanaerobacterium elongatum]
MLKKFAGLIISSARELKSVLSLAISSMLTALNVVLGFFTIQPNELLKFTFAFIPLSITGMLYGPVAGGLAGIAGDLLKFFIKPTGPYFIGFTISAFLTGFIYGLFFYKNKITLWRVALAHLTVVIFVQLLLNSVWIAVLYDKAFLALLPARVLKNFIMYPIETGMIYFVSKALEKILERSRITTR